MNNPPPWESFGPGRVDLKNSTLGEAKVPLQGEI
jgi:hypothetical protein